MNSIYDINSRDIEQGHGAKSIMLHTDSVDTEGSSQTVRDITGEFEVLEERMYRSIAFRIWMRFVPLVVYGGLVFISLAYTSALDREVNLRFVQEIESINTQLLSAPFLYN